jgi:prepilin-type N-terminal cleavage/methylation domain-containing protein
VTAQAPDRRGFTLIEVLLALLLILALSGAVASFVWGVIASRERADRSARLTGDWSRLVSLVEGAVLTSCSRGPDGSFGGSGTSIRIPCRVMHLTAESAGDAGAALGLTFEPGARRIVVTRGTLREPVMSGVDAVSIRYWTGRGWSDSFSPSASGGLPAAVEVSVWTDADEAATTSGDEPRRSPPDLWRVFAVPDGREDPGATPDGGAA